MAKHTGTILVVDDEPDVCEMIELGLSLDGYQVLTAEGGEQAIELIRDKPIDLLITDFKMPGLSGVETAMRLRQLAPELPVIVVTGYLGPDTMEACAALGKVKLIRKPFAFRALADAVNQALKRD